MKLLLLALLWVPVQERERDQDREREARAMRAKKMREMKKMREVERSRVRTEARRKLEGQIVEFGESIRAGDDEAVLFFKKSLATPAGKVVMRDRAQEASDRLLAEAEAAVVREYLKGDEYRLKERIAPRLEFFRAYQGQIAPIESMLKEIASRIADERGRNRTMRGVLELDAAGHVVYTSMFRRWYRNMVKSGRGGISESQLIEMAPERPSDVLKTYFVNNLFQKVGEKYNVNSGELYYYTHKTVTEYARKKAFHAAVDACAARFQDPMLRAFYSSYQGKDELEDARKLELQAVRDRIYDGLGDWADRHFTATENGRVLKEGSREALLKAVAQIRKVQEGLKNDDF